MVDVVALCDVDIKGKQCEKALSMYPNAKRFTDFRKLFEEYSATTSTPWQPAYPTTFTSS